VSDKFGEKVKSYISSHWPKIFRIPYRLRDN